MHPGTDDGRGDAGRKIAVANQPNASPSGANVGNQLRVTRAVQHDDDKILHSSIQSARNIFEIMRDRSVEVDGVLARRAHYYFFHVTVGSVKQATALRSG